MDQRAGEDSESKFIDALINCLPGLFYVFSEKGQVIRWNKKFEEVSGYSAEEISKMSPLDFFSDVDKLIIAGRIQDGFMRGDVAVEADFVTKSGVKIPYLFTGRRIEMDGEACLAGMGVDITERRQAVVAQAYLAAIIESSDDA